MKQIIIFSISIITVAMLAGCAPTDPQARILTGPGPESTAHAPAIVLESPESFRVTNPPRQLFDFTLPASTGTALSLSDLRGDWILLFFGYSHCPDFCPVTLIDFRQVKTALGAEADQVTFLYISVDPYRDTPDSLHEYLAHFDPDFLGMQGLDEVLAQMEADFGFFYRRSVDPATDTYTVEHSTRSYLVDPQGRLRGSFSYHTDPDWMAKAIRAYISLEGNEES